MPQNKKPKTKNVIGAYALARAIASLPVDDFTLSVCGDPIAAIVRAVIAASGDKNTAYTNAATAHNFADANDLLNAVANCDPNIIPDVLKPLDVITSDEILTTQYPDPVWAVPGLLPTGLTILAGAPKLGKSWLALQIALSVASGGMTFGKQVTKGGVLYLALEDSPRRLQERTKKQNWTRGLQAEFLTLGNFDSEIGDLTNGGGERLANQIARRGYRLVVIDTLSRSIHGDQNDAEQMTHGLTPIQEIAHAKNTAIVLIDHHRKSSGENPDAIGDILGSTAKGAMCDTTWGLYRERGKAGAKLSVTGRDITEQTLALTMDWQTGCWQCDGDLDAMTLTERRQEILDALADLGASQIDAIAKAIGQPKSNTHNRLQDLVNARMVKRITKGANVFYSL